MAFDAGEFATAIAKAAKYLAGFNALWANTDDPFTKKVPLKQQRVVELRKHFFQHPSPMPMPVKIALASNENPFERKGNLTRISQVEMIAVFSAPSISACPFQFEVIEDKDMRHFKSLQEREDAGQPSRGCATPP